MSRTPSQRTPINCWYTITLNCVRAVNPKPLIRNQGTISAAPNQVLFQSSWPVVPPNEWQTDIPYPASSSLSDGFIQLSLEFTVPVALLGTTWSEFSLQFSINNGQDLTGNTPSQTVNCSPLPDNTANPIKIAVPFKPSYATEHFPWGFAGEVTWTLTVNGQTCVQSTVLELYCLNDTLPAFFHGAVDASFLRAMVLPARAPSPPTPPSWTDYVVKACFANFGYKYEISNGTIRFGDSGTGGSYDLKRWVRGINWGQPVNCYDQAGIVMIALGLGPKVKADWVYMDRFGFINQTYLVGYPSTPCNNPFAITVDKLSVGNNDLNRSLFKNHAFVQVNDKIYDACAGPILGAKDINAYVAKAIQGSGTGRDQTDLYSTLPADKIQPYHRTPGTSADARYYGDGVTSLDACDIRAPEDDKTATTNSKAVMTMASAKLQADTKVYAIDDKETDSMIGVQNGGWNKTDKDIYVNSEGVELTWDLLNIMEPPKKQIFEYSIQVCRSHDRAAKMFENDIHNISVPFAENLEKPTNADVYGANLLGQLLIASKASSLPSNQMVSWVRGNLNISIKGTAVSPEQLFQTAGGKLLDDTFSTGTAWTSDVSIKSWPTAEAAALDPGSVTIAPTTGDPGIVNIAPNSAGPSSTKFHLKWYSVTDLNFKSKDKATKSDLILLRSVGQFDAYLITFTFQAAKEARSHTLEFAFAEHKTARVVSKQVVIQIE
ncbi:hypothetical protein B0H66DRAFT_643708 [Apodospora peruviana]|uniref:Uncharacterized protein n=1 Tax=Apodospora peruviana TaxID=516989 RepID=A0AAE0HWQ9_9PEZI|nr:hypothetical protein B0H66DRAFT_643708 [Apodospora peruviana]